MELWRWLGVVLLVGLPLAPSAAEERSAIKKSQRDEQRNFFVQLGRDFGNVFTTKENLWITSIGLGASWAVSPLDDRIAAGSFTASRHTGAKLDRFLSPARIAGGAGTQFGAAVALMGVGKASGNPAAAYLGHDLLRSQIVTQTLTQALKFSVGRERPDGSNRRSYPSGHASGAFATATVFQRHFGWKVGIPAYAFAAWVATSRLYESRHYLSDVVMGAAVGTMVGRTVTLERQFGRFVMSPMLVPRGGGVQFTWVGGDVD